MRTDGPLKVGSAFPARPAKAGRLAGYCRGLYKRLAKHEFEQPFELNKDPDQQDKLTTWIEYLGFEYVEYEKHANIMRRLQQQYDEAWKRLVDWRVLKPFETEESIWIFGISYQMINEENEAKQTVESATSTVKSAEKVLLQAQSAGQFGRSLSHMEEKLSTATSKLAAATKSLEWASRRRKVIGDFHNQMKPYKIAKSGTNRQSKLLRWILQQVPLIELELNPAKVSENDSIEWNGRRQKRHRAGDQNEEPVSKRQRQTSENHTSLESKTCTSTIKETSSTPQPRQSRSSSTLLSKPRSQQGLCASRLPEAEPDTVKSSIVLNDSAQISKRGGQCTKLGLGGAPESSSSASELSTEAAP